MKTTRFSSLLPQQGGGRAESMSPVAAFVAAQGKGGKIALALGGLWAFVALGLGLGVGPARESFDGLRAIAALFMALLPLGLVVLGLMLAEIGRMLANSDAAQTAPAVAAPPTQAETPSAPESTVPAAPVRVPPQEETVAAALDELRPPPVPPVPSEPVQPLSREEMVRALNFPDSGDDLPGFAALRRALSHPNARTIVQSAQDILTLFSQDGIYMDDLRPELVSPEEWRAYAHGQRGEALKGIGVFAEETLILRMAERLQKDAIFRDAVQHFLRNFDRMFSDFEAGASDEEIAALSETRSARGFMLAGRAARIFG